MKKEKGRIERRKHERFSAQNGTFALIGSNQCGMDCIKQMSMAEIACAVYKSNPIRMGRITDMSRGGLAFTYIDKQGRKGKSYEMDILSAGNSFFLKKLNFKTVMDGEASDEPAYSPIKLKRQRIQFVDLSTEQMEKLEHFLQQHTRAEMMH